MAQQHRRQTMITKTRPDNKAKGILLPVFSLPSPYGTGCFSEEARDFIDRLSETGHTYWQILPLGPTGVADSPYQPLSSFAGNAYFIDPVQLVRQGLISEVMTPENLRQVYGMDVYAWMREMLSQWQE